VPEALYREAGVPCDAVEEERGEVKEDERSQVERRIHEEVWLSRLKPHLEKVRSLLPIGAPRYRVAGVVRARVVGVEVAAGGFEELVWQEVKRSRNIMRSELAAAKADAPGGREADAERFSALVGALTGKRPRIYRKSGGEITIVCHEGHLKGFKRFAELADAVERWPEETSQRRASPPPPSTVPTGPG
jgi:hypothetical protein